MLSGGIIIALGALAGFCLTNVVMLANFLRRIPRGRLVVRESLAVFLTGGIAKDYRALLVESRIEPTRFDNMLYMLERLFVWSFIVSVVLLIIGLVGKIGTS
jgi:hypothetical protein